MMSQYSEPRVSPFKNPGSVMTPDVLLMRQIRILVRPDATGKGGVPRSDRDRTS
jgi:hypothetical protein